LLKEIQKNNKSLRSCLSYSFVIFIIFLVSNSIAFCAEPRFPSSIIKLPENENAILVEKKTQTLFLYSAIGSDLVVQFKATISTGESSGIKQRAGDKKTPEGIYFLKDEYEDKYLSPIYGKKAFPTDYPNFIDSRAGKNGSAIWIHGTNKKLIPMDSNGCVALENSNILKLSDYVNIDSTPVIMMEELDKTDKLKLSEQRRQIIILLNQWMQAIETGTYHEYLSFYSSQYLPDISWWEDWNKIKKQTDTFDSLPKVKAEKIGIYYHDNVFVTLFDCFLVFKNKKALLGKRKLFLEEKNNNYEIIGDVFQTIPEKFQLAKTPLIAAAKLYVKQASTKEAAIEAINQ
jgi:murein L,D-transpeptidase YafK